MGSYQLKPKRVNIKSARTKPQKIAGLTVRNYFISFRTTFTAAAKIERQMRIMIPLPIIKTDSLKTGWAQLPEKAKPETREVIKT